MVFREREVALVLGIFGALRNSSEPSPVSGSER